MDGSTGVRHRGEKEGGGDRGGSQRRQWRRGRTALLSSEDRDGGDSIGQSQPKKKKELSNEGWVRLHEFSQILPNSVTGGPCAKLGQIMNTVERQTLSSSHDQHVSRTSHDPYSLRRAFVGHKAPPRSVAMRMRTFFLHS